MTGHRQSLYLLLLASLATPACDGCKKEPPANWIARVKTLTGKVKAVEGKPPQFRHLKVADHLMVGARVETGLRGQAVLTLRNGGELMVKPDSVVIFRTGTTKKKVELALTRGSVVGTGASEMEAAELVIGVGGKKVRLTRAARAQIVAPRKADAVPTVTVTYGRATVEGPEGEAEIIVAGKTITLELPARKPDAAPPRRPDAGAAVVVAKELVFYLLSTGRGKVQVKGPGDARPRTVRRGQVVTVVPETQIILARGAKAVIGEEKGKGTEVLGPAQLVARAVPATAPGERPSIKLQREKGDLHITDRGPAGKTGSGFMVEGVRIIPRITHRRVDLRVRQGKGESVVQMTAGEATLIARDRTLVLQAGQKAGLRKGTISGPRAPIQSPLKIRRAGTIRVFVPGPRLPITFQWAATGKTLVEAGMFFSDVVRRKTLTLPRITRGTLHWRIRPLDASGKPGQGTRGTVHVLRDTSHMRLRGAVSPKNLIRERDGNTTVYYQNRLPRFTFRWEAMKEADVYQVKVFRERSLTRPLVNIKTPKTRTSLPAGKLREGTYLWYVAGRTRAGKLVRTSRSRSLVIRYDNATPNLQIKHPRNGLAVPAAQLEVKGIAIRGSRVFVNGAPAALDAAYRFTHQVSLRPGENVILFRVVHPRSGSSYYIRRVVRR